MPAILTKKASFTLVIGEYPPVTIPRQATESLSSFREWAGDNDLPENARVFFYRGEVWVEMARNRYSHM
jgi:hypothetical protein